jgi:hypothetical protein
MHEQLHGLRQLGSGYMLGGSPCLHVRKYYMRAIMAQDKERDE